MFSAHLLRAAALSYAAAFLFSACDVAVPDRPIAPDVPRQSVQAYGLDELDSREAYAGTIIVEVPGDAFGAPIEEMKFYVGRDLVNERLGPRGRQAFGRPPIQTARTRWRSAFGSEARNRACLPISTVCLRCTSTRS
jgi:hypothetical protein